MTAFRETEGSTPLARNKKTEQRLGSIGGTLKERGIGAEEFLSASKAADVDPKDIIDVHRDANGGLVLDVKPGALNMRAKGPKGIIEPQQTPQVQAVRLSSESAAAIWMLRIFAGGAFVAGLYLLSDQGIDYLRGWELLVLGIAAFIVSVALRKRGW